MHPAPTQPCQIAPVTRRNVNHDSKFVFVTGTATRTQPLPAGRAPNHPTPGEGRPPGGSTVVRIVIQPPGKYLAASMRSSWTALNGPASPSTASAGTAWRCGPSCSRCRPRRSTATWRPAKATDQIRGVSTTKPSPPLRSSITIRKAGDEVQGVGLHPHDELPFHRYGFGLDNGTEFLNKAVIKWAGERDIYFTAPGPTRRTEMRRQRRHRIGYTDLGGHWLDELQFIGGV